MTGNHAIDMPPQCQECPMLIVCEQNLERAEADERRIFALGKTALNSAKQVGEGVLNVFGNTLVFFNFSSDEHESDNEMTEFDRAHDRTLRCQADFKQLQTVMQYDCPGVKQSSRIAKLVSKTGLIDASPACQNPHFTELSVRLRAILSSRVSWKPNDRAA